MRRFAVDLDRVLDMLRELGATVPESNVPEHPQSGIAGRRVDAAQVLEYRLAPTRSPGSDDCTHDYQWHPESDDFGVCLHCGAEPCGRVLIGRGSDVADPLCVLRRGHWGRCKAAREVPA